MVPIFEMLQACAIFELNLCKTSPLYERKIRQLYDVIDMSYVLYTCEIDDYYMSNITNKLCK